MLTYLSKNTVSAIIGCCAVCLFNALGNIDLAFSDSVETVPGQNQAQVYAPAAQDTGSTQPKLTVTNGDKDGSVKSSQAASGAYSIAQPSAKPVEGSQETPQAENEKSLSGTQKVVLTGLAVGAAVLVGVGISSSSDSSSTKATTTTTTSTSSTSSSSTSSSSSSSTSSSKNSSHTSMSSVTDDPSVTPVCMSLSGSWNGSLYLIEQGERQNVTAVVKQNGNRIEIDTSSSLEYGKKFIGTIGSDCHMFLYDQTSGEDWTTHYGPVTSRLIEIYDYTNPPYYTHLDSLSLTR